MGLWDTVKSQFIDVIEYVNDNDKILIQKYERYQNEIKQGAQLIVREGQAAAFLKGGQLADVMSPGTYTLNTDNLPILSTLGAVGHLFNSPIKSDLYFVSTRQIAGIKWGTQNPVMVRDEEFGVIRIRAFGTFSFKVVDISKFMREIFGAQHLALTFPIIQYLTSILNQSVAMGIANAHIPIIDLALHYKEIAMEILNSVAEVSESIGVQYTNVILENVSLPNEVEKMIDEQSGVGIASQDLEKFSRYESIRAMRDAAKQEGGLAGLGAGFRLGDMMANEVAGKPKATESIKIRCPKCKTLNDETSKFCSECGQNLL